MEFTQYVVTGPPYKVFTGAFVKDMTPDQLRRRKSMVEEVDKGVYKCTRPFAFKAGEVVWLESSVVRKRDLKILEPVEDQVETPDKPEPDKTETEKNQESKAKAPGRPKRV